MFKRLLALAALSCAVTASAQTVTYVRPSKGKTLTVFDKVALNPIIQFQPMYSPVYDWTAFTAIQIRVDVSTAAGNPVDPLTGCGYQPIINVLGATEPGATSFVKATDPNGSRVFIDTTGFTYTVGNLSPYIKISLEDELAFGPALPDCTVKVTVVPFPTDQNFRSVGGLYPLNQPVKLTTLNPTIVGGLKDSPSYVPGNPSYEPAYNFYLGDNPLASSLQVHPVLLTSGGSTAAPPRLLPTVAVGNAVAVEVFNSTLALNTYPFDTPLNVTVENVGTVPALCALVSRGPTGPLVVTATDYTFILKASGVAKDGTGGTKTFNSFMRPYSSIQCITAAGSTTVAVQPF